MLKIVLRGTNKDSTSAVHMKICKANPHLHPAVGNKYVCMVGCSEGQEWFFSQWQGCCLSHFSKGGFKGKRPKVSMSVSKFITREEKLHWCKSVCIYIYQLCGLLMHWFPILFECWPLVAMVRLLLGLWTSWHRLKSSEVGEEMESRNFCVVLFWSSMILSVCLHDHGSEALSSGDHGQRHDITKNENGKITLLTRNSVIQMWFQDAGGSASM